MLYSAHDFCPVPIYIYIIIYNITLKIEYEFVVRRQYMQIPVGFLIKNTFGVRKKDLQN